MKALCVCKSTHYEKTGITWKSRVQYSAPGIHWNVLRALMVPSDWTHIDADIQWPNTTKARAMTLQRSATRFRSGGVWATARSTPRRYFEGLMATLYLARSFVIRGVMSFRRAGGRIRSSHAAKSVTWLFAYRPGSAIRQKPSREPSVFVPRPVPRHEPTARCLSWATPAVPRRRELPCLRQELTRQRRSR